MSQYNPYTSFAKGGGCFLADTQIKTPNGTINIQDLNIGDKITSYNEVTQQEETSMFERLDILGAREYYEITTSRGSVKATGEHPFFIAGNDTDQHVVRHANELQIGDYLVLGKDHNVNILSIHKHIEDVIVYNIINVSPNHNYFANDYLVHNKGGCFVDGTLISTPNGQVAIEDLKINDTISSMDISNYIVEDAVIADIDTFKTKGYYIVSTETQSVRVTGEHPFYVIEDGQTFVRAVEEINRIFNGTTKEQVVYNENDTFEKVVSVSFIDEVVRVHNLINIVPNHNYFANNILVHNKGGSSSGGHASSSGAKSSSSSSSGTSKSTSSSTGKAGAKPTGADASANKSSSKSTTSASTKPGSKVTTSDGKTVTTSTKVPAKSSQAGVAGVDGYTPKFKNGYTAPAGSTVYYPQHSALDYLPWVYLFSMGGDSPSKDQATIVQPDGKEVVAPPTQEGMDGLAVLNWVLLIAIVIGIIGGIVWGVNKLTNKDSGDSW